MTNSVDWIEKDKKNDEPVKHTGTKLCTLQPDPITEMKYEAARIARKEREAKSLKELIALNKRRLELKEALRAVEKEIDKYGT